MNRALYFFLLMIASCSSQAEDYPRLGVIREGMIANYYLAEAMYSELVKHREYFEYNYIDGSLCAKPSKLSKCVPLKEENERKILPLFQSLPLYQTQMTQEGLVSYIAFEECANLRCVIDAVRYRKTPSSSECNLSEAPIEKSECIVPTKGYWYIRYQFLGAKNA